MNTDNTKIHGVISALPTPFLNGDIDYLSLEKLIQHQLDNGIHGFVVNGTTAESPTLTKEEIENIFRKVKQIVKDKVPLILGVGSNDTAKTIQATKKAKELGADATLVVVPYYNKPPQRGLVEHFTQVAGAAEIPNIVYNVPGRTITGLTEESIVSLSSKKNILGIKEASGNIEFDQSLKKKVSQSFVMLTGDDGTFIPFMKLGGQGIVSVMSNVITKQNVNWYDRCVSGNFTEAEKDFAKYEKFISQLYVESNPIPVKWMLFRMGLFKSAECRLPLSKLDEQHYQKTEILMKEVGLI